jgi:adenine-specific DNA-methyltransferase
MPAFDKTESFCAKAYSIGYITRDLTSEFAAKYPLKFDTVRISGNKLVESCSVFSGWSNANKLQKFIDNNCEPIIDDDGSTLHFYLTKTGAIYYRREGRTPHYVQTVLHNMGTTEVNKYMLEAMGLEFDYPKPVELITFLLSIIIEDNSIILDSFAGSGTTAHAVLNLNKDGGNRKFILVEMEEYADSITAERVKRVIDGYGEDKNAVEGTGGDFSYYELGQPMFIDGDYLNEELPLQEIHRYIWYTETARPFDESKKSHPHLLGVNDNSAYYFFYEKDSLTTLNYDFLQTIKEKSDAYVIYADNCVLEKEFLARKSIIFKKIPRDITRF